ncbi:MAG: DNA mismatch repair endonuclease MutL [Nanoarchaeota archaeon]|nr:DNA mismatch repair endonuclease MutL [Nanoarchaeota archaeon]
MKDIIVLDDALITKIAAGEVIERPASVVKELLENSMDAGADKIFITLKEGGISYIKIEDNGTGMDETNAKKAILRHSTSKIASQEDLFSIATLGFRGEALASIASVSECILTTKQEDSSSGIQLLYRGGKLTEEKKIGCPKGTIIEVKNLFFNTPARKKYLKSMQIELREIVDIVQRYAIVHPEIHFKLVHNDNEVLNSPATTDSLSNISYIYGRNLAKELIPINYSDGVVEVLGFISKPQVNKATKGYQSFYVNRRYIKSKLISDALNNAYHTLMFINKYPVAVLDMTIDPKKIDVNVHPQKKEIRFSREKEIYGSVFEAVRKALLESDLISDAQIKDKSISQYKLIQEERLGAKLKEPNTPYPLQTSQQSVFSEKTMINQEEFEFKKLPNMAMHGIVNKTYIIAETKEELLIIDQHALAERNLYEKFKAEFFDKRISIQQLLSPILFEVDPKTRITLKKNIEALKELGFIAEEFGDKEFILRATPEILGKKFDKNAFLDIVSELDSIERSKKVDEVKEDVIMRMACRAAVKAGDELTISQVREYLGELDKKDISYTCPHGRPIFIRFTFKELEKMFKRTG